MRRSRSGTCRRGTADPRRQQLVTAGLVLAGLVTAGLVLAGCEETATEEDVMGEPEPPSSAEPVPGVDSPVARAAVRDLARSRGVAAAEVTVIAVEEVTWNDGSLGCAEPGMVYTQALVDGTRVVLEAAGERVEYHAGGEGDPFPCEEPTQ